MKTEAGAGGGGGRSAMGGGSVSNGYKHTNILFGLQTSNSVLSPPT